MTENRFQQGYEHLGQPLRLGLCTLDRAGDRRRQVRSRLLLNHPCRAASRSCGAMAPLVMPPALEQPCMSCTPLPLSPELLYVATLPILYIVFKAPFSVVTVSWPYLMSKHHSGSAVTCSRREEGDVLCQ